MNLYIINEVLGITNGPNDFLQSGQITGKCIEQNLYLMNLDLTKPRYNEQNPQAQT